MRPRQRPAACQRPTPSRGAGRAHCGVAEPGTPCETHGMRWVRIASLHRVLAAGLFLLLPGCEDEPTPGGGSTGQSETPSAAGGSPQAAAPAAAAATGECPVGKWEYDYSDRFLESLLKNSPGMKVTKKSGRVLCTITGKEKGSYDCTAQDGVQTVLTAELSGGLQMEVSVGVKGNSHVDFVAAGPGKWKTTRADMSGLQIDGVTKLNGKEIPLPDLELFPGLNRAGTEFEWRCEGSKLKWRPQVAGLDADWATMTRVN